MKLLHFLIFLLVTFCLVSCVNSKKIVYFQGSDAMEGSFERVNYQNRIQPDDILDINISSQNPEAAAPFNQQVLFSTMQNGKAPEPDPIDSYQKKNYLVNKEGNIEFPILGILLL